MALLAIHRLGSVAGDRAADPADRRNDHAAGRWNYERHYTILGTDTGDVASMTSIVPPTGKG